MSIPSNTTATMNALFKAIEIVVVHDKAVELQTQLMEIVEEAYMAECVMEEEGQPRETNRHQFKVLEALAEAIDNEQIAAQE